MSRSNKQDEAQVNPCKHWFQWDGGDGKGFKSYDKVAKVNNITPLPFTFLVLDRLTTITGFNEPEKIGYFSNEIRNLKTDKLTVRSKNGIEAEGTYEEVKAKLGTKGAAFCQSVYVMFFEGNTPTLGNIKMQGASLENWFAFCKENNIMEVAVKVKTSNEKKKGRVVYHEPVFEKTTVKDETNKSAVEIDKELQSFLKSYLERNQTSTEAAKAPEKTDNTSESRPAGYNTVQERVKAEESSEADSLLNDDMYLPF